MLYNSEQYIILFIVKINLLSIIWKEWPQLTNIITLNLQTENLSAAQQDLLLSDNSYWRWSSILFNPPSTHHPPYTRPDKQWLQWANLSLISRFICLSRYLFYPLFIKIHLFISLSGCISSLIWIWSYRCIW